LVAVTCLAISGCAGITRTPFQEAAGEAAGTLAAAAETLTAFRDGRLAEAYASASFAAFAESIRGVAEQLPTADGAPPRLVGDLAEELADVEPFLERPCLADDGCDAPDQIRRLRGVSEDLLRGVGS
jgi:hypothetical protein